MFILPPVTVPTLAVAAIYCCWARAAMYLKRRELRLRERVAYMLWAAATDMDE